MTGAVFGSLLAVDATPLDTVHGPFVAHRFHNFSSGHPALAVTRGDLATATPLVARVHSSCVTSEAFGACDCDCADQLDGALAAIAAEGRGAVFYLTQEGRGAGFTVKALDRMLVQSSNNALTTFDAYDRLGVPRDQRRYHEVAWMLRLLGVSAPLELLTNNPDKSGALAALGVPVAGHRPLAIAAHPWSRHYLAAKSATGHLLAAEAGDIADLPERVQHLAPHPIAGAPTVVRLASYLLPIRTTRTAWFRLHLGFDLVRRRERVVLSHGDGPEALVCVQHERLLERLPLRDRGERGAWARAVEAMTAAGGGCALFLPEGEAPGDDDLALLADCLGGRRARLLDDRTPGLEDALARLRVEVGVPGAREQPRVADGRR